MCIRQARLIDKKEIMKFINIFYGGESPESVKDWKKNYKKLLKSIFVFEKDEKIVGFITYEIEKNSIYIGDLYVLSEHRRNKIATKLIKSVENIKKKFGKKYLRVDVRKKDKSAIKLYKKLDFKIWKPKGEYSLKLRR